MTFARSIAGNFSGTSKTLGELEPYRSAAPWRQNEASVRCTWGQGQDFAGIDDEFAFALGGKFDAQVSRAARAARLETQRTERRGEHQFELLEIAQLRAQFHPPVAGLKGADSRQALVGDVERRDTAKLH